MKPIRTLVLVADDHGARFLMNEGVGKGLTELAVLAARQFADSSASPDDRPGRSGVGGQQGEAHAFDRRETQDEHNRRTFVTHIVEALEEEWRQAMPDRLMIAAPPKMLGDLRDALPLAAAAALVADLPKDLMKIAARDLPKHFEALSAF